MDNEIRKQNKVPGSCEQFTRPEEILGLQKYLRNVKDVYESQLELGKDNLEVTRRASIREVDQLPDNIQILDTRNKTSELISNKEWLEADKKIETLDAMRIKLGERNETSLKPFKEKLDSPIKIESLENHLEAIDDEREIKLNKNKENLTDTRKISLPNHKESIGTEELSKLDNYQEKLEKSISETELKDIKIKLEKEENNSLSRTKINLEIQSKSELENHQEKLSIEELKNLEDHKEKLKEIKETELDKTRISLGEVEDTKLSNTRVDLNRQQEPKLERYKDSLSINEKIKLEDYQEKILVDPIENLENKKIGLEDSKKVSLEEEKILLTKTEDIDNLGNTKITINPIEISGLEETKISLNNSNTEISLPNSKVELKDINNPILNETKENIPNEIKEANLENHLEVIQFNKDNTLSGTKVKLGEIKETKDLSNIRVEEIEEKIPELENHQEKLSIEELKNLEDHKETINPSEIEKLEDAKVNLEVKENNSLSETKVRLDITSENELSNFIDTLETSNDVSLEDTVIERPGVISETNLEDTKIKLEDIKEVSLEDILIKLEKTNTDPLLHDDSTKVIINPLDTENLSDIKIERGGTEKDFTLYDNNIKIIGEIDDKELHGDETLQKLISNDIELEDVKIKREGENPENKLHDNSTLISISPNEIDRIHDDSTKINLIIPENPLLHDDSTKVIINPLDTENLSDIKIERGGTEKDFTLYDNSTKINLETTESSELENTRIKRVEDTTANGILVKRGCEYVRTGQDNKEWSEDDGLEDFLLKNILDDTTKEDLEGNTHKKFDPDSETLYDSALVRPDNVTIEGKDNKEYDPDKYTSESFDKEKKSTIISVEDDTTKEDLEGNTHKKFDPEEDKLNSSVTLRPEDDETKENLRYKLEDDGELKLVKDALNHDDYNGDNLENLGKNRTQLLTEDLGKEDNLKTSIKNSDEDLEKILKERSIDNLELYKKNLLGYAKKLEGTALGGWSEKIQALVSAYLSGDEVSKERAENFERELYNSLLDRDAISFIKGNQFNPEDYNFEYDFGDDRWGTGKSLSVPMYNGGWAPKCDFKSVGGALDSLNISNYLRYIAETTVGLIPKGAGKVLRRTRALLLDETLALLVIGRYKLERVTKSNRDRLPGNDDSEILGDLVNGGAKKAMNSTVDSLVGSIFGSSGPDLSIPNNRPNENGDTENFILLSSKGQGLETKDNDHGGFFKRLGDSLMGKNPGESISFSEYLKKTSGLGFTTTLEEIVGVDKISDIKSLEDLNSFLTASPYYTSASKVVSNNRDTIKVNTLDSNIYWEIIFQPFEGNENGKTTYLPYISDINIINNMYHKATTSYSKWIPVNSFELGKSKLTSKTVSLFDGEISYPSSLEFTNEFRLTFVDDQYKSWRTYFERCVDCMIYYSKPTTAGGPPNSVIKKYTCLAPYKNVTFRCTIYSMTPQLSTISKYDLLLVLKDFTEERSGEIDGAANDLTVTFSIVGENPSSELPKIKTYKYQGEKKLEKPKGDVSSIISNGVKSGLNIIM